MDLQANIERNPLEIDSTRVVEANSYQLGNLLTLTGTGFGLADNTVAQARAVAFVIHAEPSEYQIVTTTEVVPWPEHGLGAMGVRLWLDVSGGYTTTEPRGASITVVQEVAQVIDTNHLLIFPPTPFMI